MIYQWQEDIPGTNVAEEVEFDALPEETRKLAMRVLNSRGILSKGDDHQAYSEGATEARATLRNEVSDAIKPLREYIEQLDVSEFTMKEIIPLLEAVEKTVEEEE